MVISLADDPTELTIVKNALTSLFKMEPKGNSQTYNNMLKEISMALPKYLHTVHVHHHINVL